VCILILAVLAQEGQRPINQTYEQQAENDFHSVGVRKVVPMAHGADKIAGFKLLVFIQNHNILT
jgi:hypothetical protein